MHGPFEDLLVGCSEQAELHHMSCLWAGRSSPEGLAQRPGVPHGHVRDGQVLDAGHTMGDRLAAAVRLAIPALRAGS